MSLLRLGPVFVLVWLSQSLSQLGNAVQRLGVAWWILDTTESAALAGLWIALTTLPLVLVSPLAGRLADRIDRLTIMMAAEFAGALLAIAALGVFTGWRDGQFPALLAIEVGLAMAAAVLTPASMALVPAHVSPGHVPRATSWMTVGQQVASMAGPVLGGILVASAGVRGALLVNAVSFGVSVVLLGLARLIASRGARPRPDTGATPPSGPEGAGDRFSLRDHPEVRQLLTAFALSNIGIAAIPVLVPVWARLVFHAGPRGLGLLEGALGAGILLGAAGMGVWNRPIEGARAWSSRMLVAMGLTHALVFVGGSIGTRIPGYRPFVVTFVMLGVFGILLGTLNTGVVAAFQRMVPDRHRGTFMGLMVAMVTGPVPLAQAATGWLAGFPQRELYVLLMALWLGGIGAWLGRRASVTSR
ncbi:MAG: MFS transporter [bacterium]|nr:MFS transporter [bacterium]